jgi:uncharacterized damage-inducible protein DinB
MQIASTLHDLLLHMEWADATVWKTVWKLGSDDKKLRELLRHLHGTQRAFFSAWTGKDFDRGMRADQSLETVAQWARDYHGDLTQFLPKVTEEALDREMRLPWAERFARTAHATTFGETIMQVSQHSTYHRGQVNMRLRELGGDPQLVDYIAWLWMGRPAAQWP